jgi:hypothetical protein
MILVQGPIQSESAQDKQKRQMIEHDDLPE